VNILHINTSAQQGGAARAMLRLHNGLKGAGHHSSILTRSRSVRQPDLFTVREVAGFRIPAVQRLVSTLATRLDRALGLPNLHISTKRLPETDLFRQADVIHLHNLHGRYFNYHLLPRLSAEKPIVWTLHDMWALTGHCAYSYECTRWITGCYSCPLLRPSNRDLVEPHATKIDRTRSIWRRKQEIYRQSDLHIVTPSQWLLDIVHKGILATAQSTTHIPYGIDLDLFRPLDRESARARLDIPINAQVILFVSEKLTNKRKGFALLLQTLQQIESRDSVFLLTFGAAQPAQQLAGFGHRSLGTLFDEEWQNLAYNAADLFVFPTLADNQPLVVLESLACGTPIVSFDVGGVPEMVRHLETGYLAAYRDVKDLAMGINALLDDTQLGLEMHRRCREFAVAEYSLDLQVERYLSVYDRAIQAHLRPRSRAQFGSPGSHGG
jgi:glycosyltransferase involved in cell wall biosynthesis